MCLLILPVLSNLYLVILEATATKVQKNVIMSQLLTMIEGIENKLFSSYIHNTSFCHLFLEVAFRVSAYWLVMVERFFDSEWGKKVAEKSSE